MLKSKKILLLFFIVLYSNTAKASGMQVSPDKLNLEYLNNAETVATITIANPTANVQLFEVNPDEFNENIKFNPESFTLEAGGRKLVNINLQNLERNQTGSVLHTNISVVAKPLSENKLSIGAGIKIPITIKISKPLPSTQKYNRKSNLALPISLIFLILLILWFTKNPNKVKK